MPTPPPALMMAQADAIGRTTGPGPFHPRRTKQRFDEKMSLDNDPDEDSGPNDGETDHEDWTELGLKTIRKASLSARSASTENNRKRSLPYTGRHPSRTGIRSLKAHAPKASSKLSHNDNGPLRGQRVEGDGNVIPERPEKDLRTSSEPQQPASNSPSNYDRTFQAAMSSGGPPAPLTPGHSPNQHIMDAAQPTPMDVDVDTTNRVEPGLSQHPDINLEIEAIAIFDKPIELSMQWPYIKEPDVSNVHCLSGVPEEKMLSCQREALRVYYSGNTFECVFHTPLIKFLRQLPSEYLKCLKPGSVRLSSKLSHMGFVHRALQDFNSRNADGLRPDVALVPITVAGEADEVWISWNNVDDFDGICGGWSAGQGKVAKRRRHPAGTHNEFEDSELSM